MDETAVAMASIGVQACMMRAFSSPPTVWAAATASSRAVRTGPARSSRAYLEWLRKPVVPGDGGGGSGPAPDALLADGELPGACGGDRVSRGPWLCPRRIRPGIEQFVA